MPSTQSSQDSIVSLSSLGNATGCESHVSTFSSIQAPSPPNPLCCRVQRIEDGPVSNTPMVVESFPPTNDPSLQRCSLSSTSSHPAQCLQCHITSFAVSFNHGTLTSLDLHGKPLFLELQSSKFFGVTKKIHPTTTSASIFSCHDPDLATTVKWSGSWTIPIDPNGPNVLQINLKVERPSTDRKLLSQQQVHLDQLNTTSLNIDGPIHCRISLGNLGMLTLTVASFGPPPTPPKPIPTTPALIPMKPLSHKKPTLSERRFRWLRLFVPCL